MRRLLFLYFRRFFSRTPHLLDCTVMPVTSASSQVHERKNPSKIHTAVECRGKTNDGPIQRNRPCSGLGRMRFAPRTAGPCHRRSMERSFFPGDVSAPRRTEDKLCYLFICLFIFCKIVQRKTQKKGLNGVGFVASSSR